MAVHIQFEDLPDWEFQIDEKSAGAYELVGAHPSEPTVACVGTDPDYLIDRGQREAAEIAVPGESAE